MTIELQDFAGSDKNYVQKLNANNAVLEAAVNSLQAAILGSVGAGAALVTDLFDRPGVVGTHSYVLDTENYGGTSQIDIGRRPAPNPAYGEQDVSAAWGNFNGTFDRVQQDGDLTLDAASIDTGLPKTIYVAVTANGAPQFFESDSVPNVVYCYSMTWDGVTLTDFKRLCAILGGHSLLADIAKRPHCFMIFDTETDWVSDELGMSSIFLPGSFEDNEIAEMSYEVIGFFAVANRADDDGFAAPQPEVEADDNHVKWKVVSEGEDWTFEDFDFDCSNVPDAIFIPVASGIGDERFVTEGRTFEMERTHLGANVLSARAFQWAVVCRPVYGPAMPKDDAFVDQI